MSLYLDRNIYAVCIYDHRQIVSKPKGVKFELANIHRRLGRPAVARFSGGSWHSKTKDDGKNRRSPERAYEIQKKRTLDARFEDKSRRSPSCDDLPPGVDEMRQKVRLGCERKLQTGRQDGLVVTQQVLFTVLYRCEDICRSLAIAPHDFF